jgi:hypothetical protein
MAFADSPLQDMLMPVAQPPDKPRALQIVEAVRAAGYRPTVYHHVAPPAFLGRGSQVLELFALFDFHLPNLCPRQGAELCKFNTLSWGQAPAPNPGL